MTSSYQIVSESAQLTENHLLAGAAVIGGSFGLWALNRHIRTKKVLAAFPTPEAMKARLDKCPNAAVRAVAAELEGMDQTTYVTWVAKKTNPRMGVGKAILMWIGAFINIPLQAGKAAVHAGEDGGTILDRAIDKGRINY